MTRLTGGRLLFHFLCILTDYIYQSVPVVDKLSTVVLNYKHEHLRNNEDDGLTVQRVLSPAASDYHVTEHVNMV